MGVLVDWKASTGMPSAVRQAVTHTVLQLPLGLRMWAGRMVGLFMGLVGWDDDNVGEDKG